MNKPPRLLIEDWLPAGAIGVECMRERQNAVALLPHTYLHIWWARRPLVAARAAVLGSLLPADFPHDVFERMLGFGHPGKELVRIRQLMDTGVDVPGGFGCDRAFKRGIREDDLAMAHAAAERLFGKDVAVIDPMAGGGSIPLESARLGFRTLANEYNPVACTILEATVNYPFRFGEKLAVRTQYWAKEWLTRAEKRLAPFYPKRKDGLVHAYVFARTVPCPDTDGHPHTPLVPDWHLLKARGSSVRVWAEPIVDKATGTWTVNIVDSSDQKSRHKILPKPTYGGGKGVSLFSNQQIPAEWIKAKAQAGEMRSALYAIAIKTPQGLKFERPSEADYQILNEAQKELIVNRKTWEQKNIIPMEKIPSGDKTDELLSHGFTNWADLYTPRQLLTLAVLLETLDGLRADILKTEGQEIGLAVEHLLAFAIDKFTDYNSTLSFWHVGRGVVAHVFEKHDFSFKASHAELAPLNAGASLEWVVKNVTKAARELALLPHHCVTPPIVFSGSAASIPVVSNASVSAVIVDPPYADNVQYSELADFFYVWLKRTQGHRRPEWFSSYLCDHTEEAVVNISRHRDDGEKAAETRGKANAFYQRLMSEAFTEARRILCDDGALTVMFTHKKQEAWEALFTSLIKSGFTITATWPVKTESEHSLHQAKKNAAQSTVILVARKRDPEAEVGYFDDEMRREIRFAAQKTAERLMKEGLNPVDQLVGSFGPAMEVYSRHSEIRTDTGEEVGVDRALDEASEAVAAFRIQQLAARGLQEVEAEGRFYLLCWDVLQAAEFRFNEAHLLGKAVGMDVDTMVYAGLVSKTSDKIKILSANDRRRAKKLEQDEMEETLFGPMPTGKKKRIKKGDVLKVHPNDQHFRTTLDACHALALRYLEAGGANPGLGSARQLATQQGWTGGSPVARLMAALLNAAPPALWHDTGNNCVAALYPEFRAWHVMIESIFGITPPEWPEPRVESDMPLFAASGILESDESEEDNNIEE